jgi:flagellar basal-body rod protein FlgG
MQAGKQASTRHEASKGNEGLQERKMIRSLWISKTGLDAQQTQMDVISNNLANVSTSGFKRSRAVFEDLLYQTIRQPGAQSSQQTQLPSGLQIGTGVHPVATERIFTQGNLQKTDNNLDVAIQGNGFLQVLLPDGTTAYTRDGSFQVDSAGQLVTASGYAVQPAITIPANAQSITIGRDGTVSVTQPGVATPTQVGTLQLATFVNPVGLESKGENLFVETGASGTASTNAPGTNGAGVLLQGYVETSNVNVVEELVNMIQTQRAYEMNSKAINTSDQMLQRLSQL